MAFLNGKLDEDVFMKQPEEFAEIRKENLVCHLNRSIYGLKQSPHCWNEMLESYMKRVGFIQTKADPCIYQLIGGETAYLRVYVDDVIITAWSNTKINETNWQNIG